MTGREAIEVLFAFLRPDAVAALMRFVGSNYDAAECSSSESNEFIIDFFSLADGVCRRLSSTCSLKDVGALSCAALCGIGLI